MRPSRSATQSAATGHSSQRGVARVQTVAPRSISACVYVSIPRSRQQRFRDRPQLRLDFRRAGKAFDAAMAREHALHVAVEDRRALAEREGRDRRRRRAADAGQRRDGGGIARKLAAVLRDDLAAPPHADDARGGSSRDRSRARARGRSAPRPARGRRETPRETARSTATTVVTCVCCSMISESQMR